MHGGASGSGAPIGNKNALKNGIYTADAIDTRKVVRALLSASRELIDKLK
jgi:hypothetical protein